MWAVTIVATFLMANQQSVLCGSAEVASSSRRDNKPLWDPSSGSFVVNESPRRLEREKCKTRCRKVDQGESEDQCIEVCIDREGCKAKCELKRGSAPKKPEKFCVVVSL